MRPANSEDLSAVQRLALALAQQESTAAEAIPTEAHIFVAEIGAAIAGMAVVHKHGAAHAKLTHLYVTGGHRLSGIGKALVRAVIDYIGSGIELELLVSSTNLGAQAFYQKVSFQPADYLSLKCRT